jgi:hypothetical protein
MSMCFSCAVGACNAERFGIREWWLKIGLRSVGGTQNSSCSSLPPQPPRHPPHPPHPRSPLQPPPPPPCPPEGTGGIASMSLRWACDLLLLHFFVAFWVGGRTAPHPKHHSVSADCLSCALPRVPHFGGKSPTLPTAHERCGT